MGAILAHPRRKPPTGGFILDLYWIYPAFYRGIFQLCLQLFIPYYHQLGPLGRAGLEVAMSIYIWFDVYICPLPMRFFSNSLIGPQIT